MTGREVNMNGKSYRVAMAQELLRLLAEAQRAHGNECHRLKAMVAQQVADLLR